jgi:hypothetical protein
MKLKFLTRFIIDLFFCDQPIQPEDIAVDRSLFSQERFEVSSIGCNFTSSEILSHVLHQEVVVAGKGKVSDVPTFDLVQDFM